MLEGRKNANAERPTSNTEWVIQCDFPYSALAFGVRYSAFFGFEVLAFQHCTRRFEVEDFAKQIRCALLTLRGAREPPKTNASQCGAGKLLCAHASPTALVKKDDLTASGLRDVRAGRVRRRSRNEPIVFSCSRMPDFRRFTA